MRKIKITVNGKTLETAEGNTIEALALELKLKPQRCLVEYKNAAMNYERFKDIVLKDGDTLEIMSLVAGG